MTDQTDGRDGRVVVVTGATSGIGRSAAHLLALDGARLVLTARSSESLEQTRQECIARGAREVLVVPADVGEAREVEALFAWTVEKLGRVDGVVHSAAVLAYGRFEDVPAEVFDRVVTTNVTGTANVARESLQTFGEQQHGSLVVIGSVLGKIAPPFMSTYATSKWAQQGLVRTLQIEARRHADVHVSLISPGSVDTPIYDQAGSYAGHGGRPPPPVVSPQRVARAAIAALDRPVRDAQVGPVNWLMVTGFRFLPGVFDAIVDPMMRRLGLDRTPTPDHAGNVFEAVPDREAVRGRWPHPWG